MAPLGRIGAGTRLLGAVAAVVFVGSVAVAAVTDPDPVLRIFDLAVGVAFLLLAVAARPRSRPLAAMSALVAVTWWLGSLWSVAVFWHRGPLVHLLVVFPLVWPSAAWVRAVVAAGYVVSLSPAVWGHDPVAVALAIALVVARVARADRPAYVVAAALVSTAVVGDSVARAIVPLGAAVRPSFGVYCAALLGAALLLGRELRRADTEQVTDLVVQLAEGGNAELRDELAAAVGDPTLRLGVARDGGFVDAGGNAVVPAGRGDLRRSIVIERAGGPAMIVVHSSSLQDEPALREAVERWVAMSHANSDLRERTRRSIDEVAASRRRLVIAADEERGRLARHIDESVSESLRTLTRQVAAAPQHVDELLVDRFRAVLDRLDRAVDGLAPAALQHGLRSALRELADVAPIPVTVEVVDDRVDPVVELATYYVCAEALANAVKHGSASRVSVRASVDDGCLLVTVSDDGCGGAVVGGPGSGLVGLSDRVAALGGTMSVVSRPNAGTAVRAWFPVGSSY